MRWHISVHVTTVLKGWSPAVWEYHTIKSLDCCIFVLILCDCNTLFFCIIIYLKFSCRSFKWNEIYHNSQHCGFIIGHSVTRIVQKGSENNTAQGDLQKAQTFRWQQNLHLESNRYSLKKGKWRAVILVNTLGIARIRSNSHTTSFTSRPDNILRTCFFCNEVLYKCSFMHQHINPENLMQIELWSLASKHLARLRLQDFFKKVW